MTGWKTLYPDAVLIEIHLTIIETCLDITENITHKAEEEPASWAIANALTLAFLRQESCCTAVPCPHPAWLA